VARGRTPTLEALVASARRRLAGRASVRAAAAAARETGDALLLTGGAVRDAFLSSLRPDIQRAGGDLDIALPPGRALPFAETLARRLGGRAVAIGEPPRRILHVTVAGGEVDVWEREADVGRDLYRRDFTVNALSFEIPSWRFLAPSGALRDLARRRLALPRPGVLLEDPLRVLRAARFLAELPGFRMDARALPELCRAARKLGEVAAERRLAELDRILSAPPGGAGMALRVLERCGALRALVPGSTARERRLGIGLVVRMTRSSPPVARVLLLSPLGARKAREILRRWKTTRREQLLATRLLALATPSSGLHRLRPPTRREAVTALRAVSPFFEESVLFLSSLPAGRFGRLAAKLVSLAGDPRQRERLLRPRRPLDAVAFLRGFGVADGPRLGAALAALDVALASGEVHGRSGAERLLGQLAPSRR
jgi:tRNA nucleotidyltransferase/poly(A) polymerase